MKKITSFLSLALILSVTLLLSSCNECEGGAGGGSVPADVQQQLDNLTAQLAQEAQKVNALASGTLGAVEYDPITGQWYYSTPGSSTKTPLTPTQAFRVTIGSNGNWFINGSDTGTPATGPAGPAGPAGSDGAAGPAGPAGPAGSDGTTPTIGANGNWWIGTTDTGIAAQGPAGADGTTPTIGANGNWFIGTTDTGIAATGPQGPAGADGKSGVLDGQGVYVNYMDGTTEKTIYIPQFVSNPDGTTTITVGGTTYIIPASGGGCTCNWSLTNTGGSWTISDGTNSVQIPTVPSWVDAVTVTHNGSNFEIASTADPTKKVTIPNGYADVSVDATSGVATITSADGATSIKLQKTQPVVYTVDGSDDVYVQNYDLDGNPVGSAYALPTAGQFSSLTNTVNGINTDLTKIKTQIGNWDETQGSITDSIASLDNRVTTLQSEVNSLFEKMLQALASMITNIQVEEVMSNAIGTYNGILTNLKTTKFIGYIGSFQNNVRFPSDVAGGENIKAGTVYSDTLGTLNLTVNPIGTDFSGVAVSLVNSLGEESKIKLSNLVSSDKKLMTGRTRAAGTGLYETKATIGGDDLLDPRLQMAIDWKVVKNAVKDTYHNLQDVYKQRSLSAFKGETLNEILNTIYKVADGLSTERLAVKTSYTYTTTDLNGNTVTSTKSVVSPYDISGIMVSPLGFESLPEQYRDSLRVFKKAKGFIKRLNTKIANKVISTIEKYTNLSTIESQIADLQGRLAKIQPIDNTLTTDISMHLYIKTEADLDFDQTMVVGYEIIVPTDLYNTPGWEQDIKDQGAWINKDKTKTLSSDPQYTLVYIEQNVQFHVKKTVPVEIDDDVTAKNVTIDVTDLVEPVNNAVDAIKSINALCESVNSIISNIYKVEDKLLAGNYLNRVYKFIDKASYYSAKGLYKLFQPVLLVNSDSGFGFAGIRGVHATVSGTVEVIPTTYSNGLVAPIYRKCIIVNGTIVKGSNGKNVHNDPVLDITSYLTSGENVIEYYALDYHGNESHEEYVIYKK